MKLWREIAVPHRDVLEGTFQQSEFAADITAVHTGTPRDTGETGAMCGKYRDWRGDGCDQQTAGNPQEPV